MENFAGADLHKRVIKTNWGQAFCSIQSWLGKFRTFVGDFASLCAGI
jgi:hypothetical protein